MGVDGGVNREGRDRSSAQIRKGWPRSRGAATGTAAQPASGRAHRLTGDEKWIPSPNLGPPPCQVPEKHLQATHTASSHRALAPGCLLPGEADGTICKP